MSLPTRDQCELWSPTQVAKYLTQNNIRDCAEVVHRNRIDGRRFLNLSDSDLSKFTLIHRPQLQKIVQDIKKNDDSLFNRLKRIKRKGPPKVPARDYQGETVDTEKYSDSEFDSDTYEDPQGDHDDNYEPPPRSEAHGVKAFNLSASVTHPRSQYLDSCRGRPAKPNKHLHVQKWNKPPAVIRNSPANENDGEYIDPEGDTDNDNYIDPTETTPTKPPVNRTVKPFVHSPASCPDEVYEVPEMEEDSQPKKRSNTTLQPNTQMLPPKASPRMHIRKPTLTQEPQSDEDYEVCDADDSVNERSADRTPEIRRPSFPTPRPRDLKKSNLPLIPKSSVPQRDNEVTMLRSPPDATTASLPAGFHRVRMPLPRETPPHRVSPSESRAARNAEEESGVYKQVWYASNCDRKTAEDALIRSAKDGSFLLRKSSGVDSQQPYTLVVFYNHRVYNIPVRYIASMKQYSLGKEKLGEERFNSVSDMIENHQKNPLVLVDIQSNTKDSTKLRHPVRP